MKAAILLLALLSLALLFLAPMGASNLQEDSGIVTYLGNGMTFNYPAEWEIAESWSGVSLHDNISGLILCITMHPEGYYPLETHPMLLDYLLKSYGQLLWGTPMGDPIIGSFELDVGSYSYAQQLYKDPRQSLDCEVQGYRGENVTVTFNLIICDQSDPNLSLSLVQAADLFRSFQLVSESEAEG